MSNGDDPYAERKKITFEQAERAAPLPSQLKLKEISQELRAQLWRVIYAHLYVATQYHSMGGSFLRPPWEGIFEYMHVDRDHAMADEFANDARKLTERSNRYLRKATTSQYSDSSNMSCA